MGQTFTAGITGALDQIDFGLSRAADDASATVEIRTTSGGLPTETVLASAAVPAASIPTEPALVPVPIAPVSVIANTKYAIVLTGHGFRYHGLTPGTYPCGDAVNFGVTQQWTVDPGDLAFRTYVTQPPCKLLRLRLTPPRPPIVICI